MGLLRSPSIECQNENENKNYQRFERSAHFFLFREARRKIILTGLTSFCAGGREAQLDHRPSCRAEPG